MKSRYLVLVACCAFLSGSGCSCQEAVCTIYDNGSTALAGFGAGEADTVVVRRYEAPTGFSVLKDTMLIPVLSDAPTGTRYLEDNRSYEGLNVEYYFPKVPKTVRITGITYSAASVRDCSFWNKSLLLDCTRSLTGYVRDGKQEVKQDEGWDFTITR